jgi:hypothetical protein
MKNFCILVVLGVCSFSSSTFGQYINFSGISVAALPMTINYGSGTVTISEISKPSVGDPSLTDYLPSPGTNGYQSPTGGVKMSISGTGSGPDIWQVKMAFSKAESITVHNTETYCNFEDTTLQSDGNWTQLDGSAALVVNGLGTNTISLVGANGAAGPFGYGHWSSTTSNLYMSYQLNETPGGSAGNGIEIAVPEPASLGLFSLTSLSLLMRRRR